jgi:hypothetical protein
MIRFWWDSMESYGWELQKDGQQLPVRDWRSALRASIPWLPDAVTGRFLASGEREDRKAKARARKGRSPLEGWAETIVRTYPGKGKDAGPVKIVLTLLESGKFTPDALLEKVSLFARRFLALPHDGRRWCPQKLSFFKGERWRDDPDSHPWVIVDARPSRRR